MSSPGICPRISIASSVDRTAPSRSRLRASRAFAWLAAASIALTAQSAGYQRTARLSAAAGHPRQLVGYGQLPLSFEINRGQSDDRVKFLARGQGYSLFLTAGK